LILIPPVADAKQTRPNMRHRRAPTLFDLAEMCAGIAGGCMIDYQRGYFQ
jgi:hypothetical protein